MTTDTASYYVEDPNIAEVTDYPFEDGDDGGKPKEGRNGSSVVVDRRALEIRDQTLDDLDISELPADEDNTTRSGRKNKTENDDDNTEYSRLENGSVIEPDGMTPPKNKMAGSGEGSANSSPNRRGGSGSAGDEESSSGLGADDGGPESPPSKFRGRGKDGLPAVDTREMNVRNDLGAMEDGTMLSDDENGPVNSVAKTKADIFNAKRTGRSSKDGNDVDDNVGDDDGDNDNGSNDPTRKAKRSGRRGQGQGQDDDDYDEGRLSPDLAGEEFIRSRREKPSRRAPGSRRGRDDNDDDEDDDDGRESTELAGEEFIRSGREKPLRRAPGGRGGNDQDNLQLGDNGSEYQEGGKHGVKGGSDSTDPTSASTTPVNQGDKSSGQGIGAGKTSGGGGREENEGSLDDSRQDGTPGRTSEIEESGSPDGKTPGGVDTSASKRRRMAPTTAQEGDGPEAETYDYMTSSPISPRSIEGEEVSGDGVVDPDDVRRSRATVPPIYISATNSDPSAVFDDTFEEIGSPEFSSIGSPTASEVRRK